MSDILGVAALMKSAVAAELVVCPGLLSFGCLEVVAELASCSMYLLSKILSTWFLSSSPRYIFLLDGGRLYSSWLIYNIFALGDMSFSNLLSIFSSTILALYVMVIVGTRWWR